MTEKAQTWRWVRRLSRWMLALDAWINSSLYDSSRGGWAAYDRFADVMDRFRVVGARRVAVELACEGLTLGLGGSIVLLMLAIPAFNETSDDWLKKQDLAITFVDRYGTEVGRRGIKHDDSVPLAQFPDYLIEAVLATEDRRFYDHFGIDVIGTMRALSVNAGAGGVVQGGSSITQQLAKNLFLSNQRTIERKIKEAYLALWLEFHLPKRDILKLYLDRAYMGGGTFGVQAAAEFYFGKSIRDISLPEAAMLAGLFKAPTKYAPHINLPAARARANDVLSNLVDAGYMTEGQVHAARINPATPVDRARDSSPDWYLDYAYSEVKKLSEENKLGDDRVVTVRLALDSNLQRKAESAIEDALRQDGPRYHAKQAASVVLEPTGAVRAIVGGRDYGESQFNRAIDATRQPGSSFKPFVYLTAILTGRYHANTVVDGSSVCIGNWCPRNFGGEGAGRIPLLTALEKSLNTVAVRLSILIGEAYWPKGQPYHLARIAELGRSKIVDTAHKMGVTTPLPDTVSLPIGADEVRMIDMAAANAAFANGGKRVEPFAALEIRNSRGDVIYRHDRDAPPPVQVIPADKIAEANNMLTHVVTEGTGTAARLDGVMAAGKTGTTNSYRDAWFNGFTGNFVGSVWFGNDDFSSMNNMTGGTLPARTWHEIMAYAHQNVELKPPYGVPDISAAPKVAQTSAPKSPDFGDARPPATLSRRSSAALADIDALFRQAATPSYAGLGAPVAVAGAATLGAAHGPLPRLGKPVDVE